MMILFVLGLLRLNCGVMAQEARATRGVSSSAVLPSVTPVVALGVGDKVPEAFWKMELDMLSGSGSVKKTLVSEFRGKGLLIDFWACWCGSCIVKFPKLDSLQGKFEGKLKILPVNARSTRDTHVRIAEMLSGKSIARIKLSMPTVVDDEQLAGLFPHKGLPYYVWINQSGVVKAISMSFMLSGENIEKMLSEDQ